LVHGFPSDDEAAAGERGDRGFRLIVGGRGVDREFAAELGALGIETLGEDAVAAAVLVLGLPGDD